MSQEISQVPAGLIALLGLRDVGGNPRLLATETQLTIESFELYALSRRETLFITGQAGVVGAQDFNDANASVPSGEFWYVPHYFVRSDLGAGVAVNLAPTVRFQSLGMPLAPARAGAANEFLRVEATRPLFAGPGSVFGYLAQSMTGAPTISGGLVVTRFRV